MNCYPCVRNGPVDIGAPCRTRTCDLLVRSCSGRPNTDVHHLVLSSFSTPKPRVRPWHECDCYSQVRTAGGHKFWHRFPGTCRPARSSVECRLPTKGCDTY